MRGSVISRILLLLLAYFAFFTVLVSIQFPREDFSAWSGTDYYWVISPREIILSSGEDRILLLEELFGSGEESTEVLLYADD